MRDSKICFQWHITSKCDNRCLHCYQDKYEGDISLDSATQVVEDFFFCCEMFEADPVIAITGGNPFLHKNFWDILGLVESKKGDKIIGILGNPESLDEKTCSRLARSGINHFQLSLDGLEGTHDKIRREGSYQRTIEGIKKLKRHGVKTHVLSTVSGMNIDEMAGVMHAAYETGADNWSFSRWIAQDGDNGLNPYNYNLFLKRIKEDHYEYEKRGKPKMVKEPLLVTLSDNFVDSGNIICGGCGLGSTTITMLPDLSVMACRRCSSTVLGKWSPEENFLYYFLESEKMVELREIEKIEMCGDCEHLYRCRGCRAEAYSKSGNIFAKDPECIKEVKKQTKN